MISRVLLLLLLVAALAWAMVNVRSGPAEVRRSLGASSTPRQERRSANRVGRPSSYWHLERRYVAALKREGRLGAEVRRLRRHEQARTLQAVGTSDLERSFLCIYAGENGGYGWSAETGNGYHGGLQMDEDFEKTYGRAFYDAWGHASNWPETVQIAVAIRAYLSGRGFAPWPNTSRACGLR